MANKDIEDIIEGSDWITKRDMVDNVLSSFDPYDFKLAAYQLNDWAMEMMAAWLWKENETTLAEYEEYQKEDYDRLFLDAHRMLFKQAVNKYKKEAIATGLDVPVSKQNQFLLYYYNSIQDRVLNNNTGLSLFQLVDIKAYIELHPKLQESIETQNEYREKRKAEKEKSTHL